ncbi:hypothetical protein HK405_001485, partial [Cladochytrium tenue]
GGRPQAAVAAARHAGRLRRALCPRRLAGYGAPAALVANALRAASLDPPPAVATPQQARERWVWPRDADRVVDEFLKRRFPTNKADQPGAGERIWRAQDALAAGAAATTSGASASSTSSSSSSSTLPPPPTVAATAMPACAAAEAWLQRSTARGAIAYAPGDDGKDDDESEAEHAACVLAALGNTGVLRALSAAILLLPPLSLSLTSSR